MAKEFRLQDPGEGIHEAEIREIAVSEGDQIAEGDTVFVVETDKASVDLPAPYAGTVASIDVAVDDVVEVGALLMTIDTGEDDAADEASDEHEEAEPEDAEDRSEDDQEDGQEDDSGRPDASEPEREPEAGEEEKRAAEDDQGQEGPDRPSGDEAPDEEGPDKEEPEESGADRKDPGASPVKATPATRRVARELGVDLAALDGSGPDGRVTEADVRKAAEGRGAAPDEGEAADGETAPEPERVPLRSVRRAVARTMARSWAEIPHVTHHDTVDVTELERLRRRQRQTSGGDASGDDGPPLTLTPFLVKAAAAVLPDHPRFNASLDTEAEEIVLHRRIHIGVATATERGLLVPVIRDAGTKDILTLAAELTQLTDGARDGSLGRDQLSGGTFSITNVGPLGGQFFTPIINPPQAAILGVGRAILTPVAEGDLDDWGLVARLMLPLSLGFDHRLNDGADAARFVSDLAAVLADPEQLLLRA